MFFPKENKVEEYYKKIIIKYDEKTTARYSLKSFSNFPFLKNYITKEKFKNIIDKANIIIYDAKMKKAKFDTVEINTFTYFLIITSLVFIIVYGVLFYISPRIEDYQIKLKTCGIIFFCASIFILICIELFYSLRRISGDKTLFEFYKSDLVNYLNQVNREFKDNIIFSLDESNKNLILQIKSNEKMNTESSYTTSNNISSEIDTSSQVTQKSLSNNDLYSMKTEKNI